MNSNRAALGCETVGKVGVFRHWGWRIVIAYSPKRVGKDARDRQRAVRQLLNKLKQRLKSQARYRTSDSSAGTLWTSVHCVIETPMFVDIKLTFLVQISDLCAYTLRLYLENGESTLFHPIFERADRIGDVAIGVRHFRQPTYGCAIYLSHQC